MAPTTVSEEEELVVFVEGRLRFVIDEPGCYCVNPCCTSSHKVSLKKLVVDLPDVKVADKGGSPIVMSGVVSYRVVDAMKATLTVSNVHSFTTHIATATMKSVANRYPYEGPEEAVTLKGDSAEISVEMKRLLQAKVVEIGVEIEDFRLTDCTYSHEIASAMLVRQKATATVDARQTIVDGAIDITTDAIRRLEDAGVPMSDAGKERLASNLLVAIASDSGVQSTMPLVHHQD